MIPDIGEIGAGKQRLTDMPHTGMVFAAPNVGRSADQCSIDGQAEQFGHEFPR